eukprot:7380423-Prymnesium_polylepis.1
MARVPVETGVSNVRRTTSYTPTTLASRGAKTTRLPTAATPQNLSSMVRLPVQTESSNISTGDIGDGGGGTPGGSVGGAGGRGGVDGAGHRAPQSVQSAPRVHSA